MRWSHAIGGILGGILLGGLPATAAAEGATASFSKSSDWGSGFVGHYEVRNGGTTPLDGWTVEFDLPPGVRIASAWSGRVAASGGHHVLTPEAWTRRVAPGAAVTVGFEGSALTPFGAPANCRVDGAPCDGDPAPEPEPEPEPEPDPPITPAGGLTASFEKASDWGTGFVGRYVIRNGTDAAVDGWRLELELPAGAAITEAWSGRLSGSGRSAVLTPEPWTRTIAPGASVEVGFQGTATGGFAGPVACSIDGRSCADGGPVPPPDTTPPSPPADLRADAATASGVTLSWTAATDDRGVARYEILADGDEIATAPGSATTAVVGGLAPRRTYAFRVRAVDAAGNRSPASAAVDATTTAAQDGDGSGATPPRFAPYVDMTLWPQFSLGGAARDAGVKHVTMAFVVSGAQPCTPTWGTYLGLDDPWVAGQVADLRAAGGTAIVSFGGAINRELAETCPTVDALAAQYQAVIDRYGIRDLDFDIEGAAQTHAASLERRFKAIAKLQAAGLAAGRPVRISLTLPVMPSGLTHDGLNVVRSAIVHGVDVGTVNVMAMDYFDPSLPASKTMGDHAVAAATAVHGQLAGLYPQRSAARLWSMVGVTPMLGINDNPSEVFTTADAAKLTAFARDKGLGRLSMWSANRDAPCPAPTSTTQNTCSGVPDPAWAFSRALGTFGGSA